MDLTGKKVYIAGPMTGLPLFNRPAFFAAEAYLKDRGAKVMNPAMLPDGFSHQDYMSIAIPMMMTCEAVAFLPGWEKSQGAQQERMYGEAFALDLLEVDLGTPVEGQPWGRGLRVVGEPVVDLATPAPVLEQVE